MNGNPVPRRNPETPETGGDLRRSSFDIGVGQRCAAGDDCRRLETAAETGAKRVVEVDLIVDEPIVLLMPRVSPGPKSQWAVESV